MVKPSAIVGVTSPTRKSCMVKEGLIEPCANCIVGKICTQAMAKPKIAASDKINRDIFLPPLPPLQKTQ